MAHEPGLRIEVSAPGFPHDLGAFYAEYQSESDRAAAVLAGAYLDHQLGCLLAASFAIEGQVAASLVTGPLGRFSIRIQLARAIGLIGEDEFADLLIIKKIRNNFAHDLHGLSFESPDMAVLARSLRLPLIYVQPPSSMTARGWFNIGAGVLTHALVFRSSRQTRFPQATPMYTIPDVGTE